MRSARQHSIDRALLRALKHSAPYLVPELILMADTARLVQPRATQTELADSLRYHDTAGRLISVQGETEAKWLLAESGIAWLAQND